MSRHITAATFQVRMLGRLDHDRARRARWSPSSMSRRAPGHRAAAFVCRRNHEVAFSGTTAAKNQCARSFGSASTLIWIPG